MQHAALLQGLGISASAIAARGLIVHPEAKDLTVAELGEDGKEHLLIPAAAKAWKDMKAAASRDAILLCIVSAFRSVDRQIDIIKRKLAAGQRLEEILGISAPPGFSEHHTGRAVDIGTIGVPDLELEFETSAAFGWLRRHATTFGFKLSYPPGNSYGYQYEPWHWCYVAQPALPGDGPCAARSARG